MPAEAFHEFSLSPDHAWDASAAEPGLRQWASSDGSGDKDKIDWQKLQKVYFWHDSDTLSEFGQLKFPYCRIESGQPHVVKNACSNTLSRVDGSNIPADDKPDVRQVAQRQLNRFGSNSAANSSSYASNNSDLPEYGVPTPEQLAKINKLAKRNLKAEEVFVFPSKFAGDMVIPDRYIQLTKELLDVFAANAQKGVSFLLDHSWHADGFWGLGGRPKAAIPYGRTFDSHFGDGTENGETVSLYGDTYMKRGVEIDGIRTDDLIQSIESGTLFDTSIGFNYGKAICSVCGNDYNGGECEHRVGEIYEIEDEDGNTKEVLCWVKAYPPGGLWEHSAVFDGAYPSSEIMSAAAGDVLENEHGIYQVITDLKDIDPVKPIIATYSPRVGLLTMVKKANHKKPFAIGGLVEHAKASATDRDSIFAIGDKLGITRMQVENIAKTVLGTSASLKGVENKVFEKMLEKLKTFGIKTEEGKTYTAEEMFDLLAKKTQEEMDAAKAAATPVAGVSDVYMTKERAKEKLGKEIAADEVLKLAADGQEFASQKAEYDLYRKETVDNALAMGVRAMGNDFPAETWKQTFASMGKKAIEDISKTWETQAKTAIPAGRHTDPAAGTDSAGSTELPDEAFEI